MNMFIPLRLKLTIYTLILILISSISETILNAYFKLSEPLITTIVIIAVTLFISLYALNRLINIPIENILSKIDDITKGT